MGIRLKLIGFLLVFGFVILGALLWSNQYVLHNTMLHYVDQRDQQRLARLQTNLQVLLDYEPIQQAEQMDHRMWLRMLKLSHRIDLQQNPSILPLLFRSREDREERAGKEAQDREPRKRPTALPDEFETRVSLTSPEGLIVFGPPLADKTCVRLPILHDGDVFGYVGYHPLKELAAQADIEFARTQDKMMTIGAVLISLLSLLMLWPLANHFLVPIRQLNQAMHALAGGAFAKRLPVNRKDEFGQLQRDFNYLAATLEAANQSRNQWVADISHELRTPLTVLSGSIEAMRDGIRPMNQENLSNLQQEVGLLQRLIEDLYQLSLSDVGALQYEMQETDLVALIAQSKQPMQDKAASKGLQVRYELGVSEAILLGDEKRLMQLLINLLKNAVDYTDPLQADGQAGVVVIELLSDKEQWCLRIADSAPAVPSADLQKLSERFYRAEASRNRRTGGAGLGLAMVSQIIKAHQGKVRFAESSMGGLLVEVRLPRTRSGSLPRGEEHE